MIHLAYSNRTEALFERFARDLSAHRAARHLFEPTRLVVPNRNVENWLKRSLAQRDGIAANFEVLLLRSFLSGLVRQRDPGLRLIDSDLLRDLLLSLLLDERRLSAPELSPVREYLKGGGESSDAVDRRRVQLAVELARLFEEYGFSRPEMIEAWPERATLPEGRWREVELWQRRLWLEILGRDGLLARRAQQGGERYLSLPSVLTELPAQALGGGEPVFLFGVSYVATLFQRALSRIAQAGELFVYTLNPCMEFWEDLTSGRETARRERLPRRGVRLDPGALVEDDPFGLKQSGDTPALVLWGRPGRENIRLLDQLSQCDFREAFEDPLARGPKTLLAQLQRDILMREPERTGIDPSFHFAGDASVQILACPGVRREAEAIAARIWRLVREDEARPAGEPPLRFTDIAVMVAGSEPESHFTHLASAFQERGFEIPYTLEATALSRQSPVAEAAELLLELPLGRFTRAEVLRVLGHPVVAARFPEADPKDWARWCDELGVFHGADRGDHEGSYLERDLHNWDQGLRRLALGAAMADGRGPEPREFELGAERYLPEERNLAREGGAAELGRLARSLLSDARFARTQRLSMGDWADFLARLLESYLVPRSEWEKGDLERCIGAVRGAGETGLDGRPVGYRIASELATRALGELTASRGSRRADQGVSLSTLQPMRALPFRVIFVAGLSEGRFPSADRKSELDLRGARPRAGDVSARERDQYMFLETLLSARERLCLSFVARDELTGEPLQPSPVVAELVRMLGRGYLDQAGEALTVPVALRRFDEQGEVPPEARSEGQLRAIRRTLQGPLGAPVDWQSLRTSLPEEAFARLEGRLRRCRPPAGPRELAADGPLRVRLSDLRRFLECPLQGSARFLLRLREDEEDRALVEDEPFDGGRLELMVGQRHVFKEWLRWGRSVPFEKIAQDWAGPRIASGRLPAGFLWEAEKRCLLAGPTVWKQLLESQGTPVLAVQVHRFGQAGEGERVDRAHDPIPLEVDGRPVQLVGTTGPIYEDGAGELGLYQRSPKGGRLLEEARCQHDSLGAFLDHLALSAAGLRKDGFLSVQLYDRLGGSDDERYYFAPVEAARASGALAGLVRELMVVRELLLPAVAVFAWRAREGAPFAEVLDEVIERGYFASQYGPVRNADGFRRPGDEEARALVAARFRLYFELTERVHAKGART